MKTRKKSKTRNIILIILDIIIVLIAIYFVIGYFNFFRITKEQKPVTDGKVTTYQKNGGEVTVNNYTVYKIVKYQVPNQKVSYSMKLWFMDDVK